MSCQLDYFDSENFEKNNNLNLMHMRLPHLNMNSDSACSVQWD
jgi:hypothetical protein